MPIRDRLQILLPKAIDLGAGVIATRKFDIRIFCKTQSLYRIIRLEKLLYAPSWPKVEAKLYYSNQEILSVSGDGGSMPFDIDVTDYEHVDMALFNNTIDTEVRFTLYLVGWQLGEG